MKASVPIVRGIESLFGTRDENIRLFESGLKVSTQLINDSLEIEGEPANVARAENILEDYVALVREGHIFNNGDLNSYLRVCTEDPEVSLRALVSSGRQRTFGKKALAPKTVNQRRYMEAIERNDLVIGGRELCRRRWTLICGRSTTRCTTCWSRRKWRNCWSGPS